MDDNQDSSEQSQPPVELSAEEARGGEIILRSRTRRIIFIAGLAGFVILALILLLLGRG